MNTNRLAVSALSTALALAGAVACSTDTTTAPARVGLRPAVFDLFGNANAGQLQVCKSGTAATFTVTFGGNFNAGNIVAGTLTPAGGTSYTFGLAANTCSIIYSRPTAAVSFDPNVTATVVETAPAGGITFVSVTTTTESGNPSSTNPAARSGTVAWNMFHDAMVEFVNAPPPPPPPPAHCTFTQGYYKNHEEVVVTLLGSNNAWILAGPPRRLTVSANNLIAYTAAQIDEIYGTPPQGGDAELILLHQLITAELNVIGGSTPPPAVATAISQARTLMNGGISDAEADQAKELAGILDDFNNGITGPGHCD